MKWFVRTLGIIGSICLFIVLLINAFDYSIYYRPQFYKETFAKYQVTEYAQMEMSEVLKVSDYLIDYLKDDHASLEDFRAVVNEDERLFYSEKEILHMEDVKDLFMGGIRLRRICLIIVVLILAGILWKQRAYAKTLIHCVIGTFLSLLGLAAVLAGMIASNFSSAFTKFHKLFFDNDLWLLNPNEDWVIRLLPEGFFKDMVMVIGSTFAVQICLVLGLYFLVLYMLRHKSFPIRKKTHS